MVLCRFIFFMTENVQMSKQMICLAGSVFGMSQQEYIAHAEQIFYPDVYKRIMHLKYAAFALFLYLLCIALLKFS